MSWLYVPASEASNSGCDSPSQPLAQSVMWRGKRSPSLSRSPVFATVILTMRQSGAMSKPSTASRGVALWIASLAATRASHFPLPVDAKEKPIPDTCGPISGESSLKSNPGSASLKTWLDIFNLVLNQYGETYAIWVTRLRRDSLRRQKLAPHINDSGSSSWPTPRTSDQYGPGQHGEGGPDLRTITSYWGTPRSTDYKGAGQVGDKAHTHRLKRHYLDAQALMVTYGLQPETTQTGGTKCDKVARDLNPRFVEWLMGFPIGWTDLLRLGMPSCQQWQQKHGDNYERRR